MPDPTSGFSTDAPLYEWLYKPLATRLCFLEPNWITAACLIMIVPILYGLSAGWSLWLLVPLMFVRQSLDCLDGSVARQCKKQSRNGAIFDMSEDILTTTAILGFVFFSLWKQGSPDWILWSMAILGGLLLAQMVDHLTGYLQDAPREILPIQALFHDNSVFFACVSVVVIRLLIV